jgi:subtilase family serine protease
MRVRHLTLPRLILLHFCCLLIPALTWSQAIAPQSRITQTVNDTALITLKGNTHPLAQAQFDRGAAPPDLPMARMLLVLKRSAEQEANLQKLLDDQQDRSSPSYHQWLTPDAFGHQFGPSDQDLQTVIAWLQSHGFQITPPSRGRTVMEFSGTANQVQQAFHTEIHKYTVYGEEHWANASDPQIPTALAPVTTGIVTLHNFPRKPLYRLVGAFSRVKGTGQYQLVSPARTGNPFFTGGGGCGLLSSTCYALGPYDFAAIYNVLPLWSAASPIDGTGQSIAIVGQTDINLQDASDFRIVFGLPALNLNVIHNGPDPGIIAPGGDETESDLDVEWAGAVAKGATIDFVVSASTNSTEGVDLSAEYIIDNDVAPILSESYGACELDLGTAGNQFHNLLWQQAAAEGITVFVAAGDSGSAVCDRGNSPPMNGLSVSGVASTPYGVAVGGTDFNDLHDPATYWNSANVSTTGASAKGYIPEMTWNDSCTNSVFFQLTGSTTAESDCNNTSSTFWPIFLTPTGGSGGASNCTTPGGSGPSTCAGGYSKPSWQTGAGVPNDGKRDLPDVSLFAGDNLNASTYLVCEGDLAGECSTVLNNYVGIGGTSVSAPAFAGIMAMVNQYTQSRQGEANYVLYPLAARSGASCNSSGTVVSSCIFHDVTTGTNAMPCVTNSPNCLTDTSGDKNGVLSGYDATSGYDLATGLGSVNVANLVNEWTSVTFQPTVTTLTLNGGSVVMNITHGTAVNVNVAVAPQSGNGTPTGFVSLLTSNQRDATDFPLSNGTVSSSTAMLPGGGYTVTAHYSGDGTFAASESSPGVAVTVNPEPSITTVQPITMDQSGNSIPFITGPYGGIFVYLRANVAGQSGEGVARGTVNLTRTLNGTATNFTGNPYPLNSEGYAMVRDYSVSPYPFFTPGTYLIVANYNGDESFNPSTSPVANFTITKAQTSMATNIVPCSSGGGQCFSSFGSDVTISASVPHSNSAFSQEPTGTVTFYTNGTQLGSPVVVDSSITPPVASFSTIQLPLGQNNITAQYGGDGNYSPSTSSASSVEVKIQTILGLTASPTSFQPNQIVTITAQVTPTQVGGPAPTGTVQFIANGTIIGDPPLNSKGQAQVTTNSLQTNPFGVAAIYSGDVNYVSSNSSVQLVAPDFVLTTNPNPPNIMISSPGSSGMVTIAATEEFGFSGTVNLSLTCPSVAAEIICGINLPSITLTGTSPVSATLTVTTTSPSRLVQGGKPMGVGLPVEEITLIGVLCILLLACGLRKSDASRWKTAFCLLILVSGLTWAGCGSGGASGGGPNPGTPPGTYTVVVSATSGNLSHSTTVTVTVR